MCRWKKYYPGNYHPGKRHSIMPNWWDMSIHGWDKTTSGFEKWTAAIWNSISGFCLCLIFVIRVSFCIGLPNFVKIEKHLEELWRHIDFSIWRPAAILDLITHVAVALHGWSVGLTLVLKFGLHRIYSLGDIAIFNFNNLPFWLEIAYSHHFLGFRGIFPQMTSPIITLKMHFFTRKKRR